MRRKRDNDCFQIAFDIREGMMRELSVILEASTTTERKVLK